METAIKELLDYCKKTDTEKEFNIDHDKVPKGALPFYRKLKGYMRFTFHKKIMMLFPELDRNELINFGIYLGALKSGIPNYDYELKFQRAQTWFEENFDVARLPIDLYDFDKLFMYAFRDYLDKDILEKKFYDDFKCPHDIQQCDKCESSSCSVVLHVNNILAELRFDD